MSADIIRNTGLPGVMSFLIGCSMQHGASDNFKEMAEASLEVVEKAFQRIEKLEGRK